MSIQIITQILIAKLVLFFDYFFLLFQKIPTLHRTCHPHSATVSSSATSKDGSHPTYANHYHYSPLFPSTSYTISGRLYCCFSIVNQQRTEVVRRYKVTPTYRSQILSPPPSTALAKYHSLKTHNHGGTVRGAARL